MTYLSAGSPKSGLGVPALPAMLEAVVLPRARRSTSSFCLGNSKPFLWVGSSLHAVGFHTFGKLGERDKGTQSLTHPKSPVDFSWLLLPPLQLSILEPEPESLPAAISQIFLMSSIIIICWPLSPLYSLPPSVSSANCPRKLSRSPSQPAQAQAQAQESHPFTQPEIATTIWGDQAGDSIRVPALSHAFV